MEHLPMPVRMCGGSGRQCHILLVFASFGLVYGSSVWINITAATIPNNFPHLQQLFQIGFHGINLTL